MTSYRHDLGAAQLRLAHLERELADRDATIARLRAPRPAESEESVERDEAQERGRGASEATREPATDAARPIPGLRDAWPVAVLAITMATYVGLRGFGPPTDPWSLALSMGAVASLLLAFVSLLRYRARGRSSVLQRLLTVVAYVFGAPLVIGLAFVLLPIAGGVMLAGVAASGTYDTVRGIYRYIAGRSS